MKIAHKIWRCSSSIWLFLLVLSLPYESISQNIATVSHLEEKEGLASRIIDKIVRDSNGYFYLFFDKAVQRYDGENFKNIIVPELYKEKNSTIQNVHITNSNLPLIQINNSISNSVFVIKNQLLHFINYPLIELTTPMSSIFICGNEYQLFSLNKLDKSHYSVSDFYTKETLLKTVELDTLPDKLFYESISKTFIAETHDSKVYSISQNGTKKVYGSGRVVSSGHKIIFANNLGIYKWNEKDFQKIYSFPNAEYKCLWAKADKSENILIALHTNVAKIVELYLISSDDTVQPYNSILQHVENIRDIYSEDFRQKMLIGGYNGLFVISFQDQGIKNHIWDPSLPSSSFGSVITGIAYDIESKKTYFTRETNGLYTIDTNNQVQKLDLSVDYTNSNSLAYDEKNRKIYTTRYDFEGTGNLNIYDIEENKSKSIKLDFSPQSVTLNDNGHVLISGDYKNKDFLQEGKNGAILIYNTDTEEIIPNSFTGKYLNNSIRISRYFDEYKQYWVGTNDGLFVLNENKVLLKEFSKKALHEQDVFPDGHIRMVKSINNQMFIGTLRDGLYIIDPVKLEVIDHLIEGKNLTNSSIISAEQDRSGRIWLGSFNGLNVLDDQRKTIRKLYIDEGISNPEFNTMASAISSKGNVLFGSINGITEVNPNQALIQKEVLNLNIEKATLYSKGKLSEIEISNKIVIPEKSDSLLLNFSIPTYIKQYYQHDENKVQIRKNGDLQAKKHANTITLTNLTYGKHHLDLFLAHHNTNELIHNIPLEIKVKRNYLPWLIAISSVLGIIGVWYLFTIQKIKSNRLLEEEKTRYNKKLADLELSALRSQMNPHFIFNALGAIQYFINTKDIDRADDYLTKFAKLIRSILESSKSKYIRLQDEIDMLQLYVSLEHIRFEEKFEYEFEVDSHIDLLDFTIPSMIIQPIVENAINHGIYHLSDRKGQLKIQFKEINEEHIICKVIDNGIGREAAKEFRKDKAHKSRGMQIVGERITALKMHEVYTIDISTHDLYAKTTGTVVEISIERKV